MTPSNEPTKALMPCPDGTVVYLLMVNELEQDGHSRDYVRDAFSAREEAEAVRAEAKRRYEVRVSKMTGQQRHRHAMESFSVEEVTVTNSAPLPGVTMGGEVRVTEEMVERALVAYHGIDWPDAFDEREHHYEQEEMRAALSAALSLATKPQSAEVREVSEEDVERALTAYCGPMDSIGNILNKSVPVGAAEEMMRAALVA